MRYLFSIYLICLTMICCAQQPKYKLPPVMYSIQEYADTTFVFKINDVGGIVNLPKFYFLSKKDTLINIYYLGDPRKGIKMPDAIASKLKGLALLDTTNPAINLRFSPHPLGKKEAMEFWNKVMGLEPWQLKSGQSEQSCPNSNTGVYDGILMTLLLITKDSINELNYYNPAFYEKECPGNPSRFAILKLKQYYEQYFGF